MLRAILFEESVSISKKLQTDAICLRMEIYFHVFRCTMIAFTKSVLNGACEIKLSCFCLSHVEKLKEDVSIFILYKQYERQKHLDYFIRYYSY